MHEVLSTDMGGGVRAWFGRMFMPPPSARLQLTSSTSTAALNTAPKTAPASTDAVALSAEGESIAGAVEAAATQRSSSGVMMSFAEYRALTYELFNTGRGAAAPSLGCSPSRRRLVDEGSCGADQVGLRGGEGRGGMYGRGDTLRAQVGLSSQGEAGAVYHGPCLPCSPRPLLP